MKIKYKNKVGKLISEVYSDSCMHCCFKYDQDCIPYTTWRCFGTIFKESESQVFDL